MILGEPWLGGQWAVIGFVLIALELLAPGVFLLWLGIAALTVAVGCVLVPFQSLWIQLIVFSILACIFSWIGKCIMSSRVPDTKTLNKRAERYIGQSFYLEHPIVRGVGHLTIDDTLWILKGDDLPAYTQVTVVGVENNTLVIKKA